MKEDEAKKKLCGVASEVQNEGICCCASGCMMWRWETLYGNMPSSGKIVEAGRSSENGYCGLAGKE